MALTGLAACMPASWGAGGLIHPFRRPLTVPRPSQAEEVEIDGEGVKLKGWFFHGVGPSRGTVIYLHGSADNRASGIPVAEHFSARGFDVLLYDSRALGESQGDACTYGYFEKHDLRRAIDCLAPKPLVVFGTSLGAAVALQAAAEDARIATVVAIASFSDLRTVATERAPFFASKRNIEDAFKLAEATAHFRVDEVSPVAAAERIRIPVLLVHGEKDRETPPAHSERILKALRSRKRLILVPRASHNDSLRAEVWQEIHAWVDSVVSQLEGAG